MKWSDKALAYGLLRVVFGVNFAMHGLVRIGNGVGVFAATTAEHLAKAPLPHGVVYGFGYVIPWIEVVLGVGLVLGVLTWCALVGGACFMVALMLGVTANQQWDVAAQQLIYCLIFFVLLSVREHNHLSVDGWWSARRTSSIQ